MEVVDNVERCGKCLSPKCFRRKAASQCGAQHVCRILHVLMKDWQDDPEKALSPQLYLLVKEFFCFTQPFMSVASFMNAWPG
jgi:hypothetical protein